MKLIELLIQNTGWFDPRDPHKTVFPLPVIIAIVAIGKLCGCKHVFGIAEFCRNNFDVLGPALKMKRPPSHDTISRALKEIPTCDSDAFLVEAMAVIIECKSLANLVMDLGYKHIAIDGKVSRGTKNVRRKKQGMTIVNAYDVAEKAVIASELVEQGRGEISGTKSLIGRIPGISGSMVTIDAAGTNLELVAKIHNSGANFLLPVKGNQLKLQDTIEYYLRNTEPTEHLTTTGWEGGCAVVREVEVFHEVGLITRENLKRGAAWPIRSVVKVTRWQNGETKGARTFISNQKLSATEAGHLVRSHWGVESMHWHMDNTFGEDRCQVKDRPQAYFMSCLSKVILALLKRLSLDCGKSIESKQDFLRSKLARGYDTFMSFLSLPNQELILGE